MLIPEKWPEEVKKKCNSINKHSQYNTIAISANENIFTNEFDHDSTESSFTGQNGRFSLIHKV